MFVISSERSDERSLLLAVVGMTGPLFTPRSRKNDSIVLLCLTPQSLRDS